MFTLNPVHMNVVRPAVEHAMTKAITPVVVKAICKISNANIIPQIGAIKMPAIPAPAPQATSVISVLFENPNNLPRLLPTAAPV